MSEKEEKERKPSKATVYSVGNSSAITVPADHIKRLDIHPGVLGHNTLEVDWWKVKKVVHDE